MSISLIHSLEELSPDEWNSLGQPDYPFTRYHFLLGLEKFECLKPFGWYPVYFLLRDEDDLLAALPCYIKTNSYGELVFDHAWANAYQRNGIQYYPKLVTAIPYTPATGERFLINLQKVPDAESRQSLRLQLCDAVQDFCRDQKISSWHILFEEMDVLQSLQDKDVLLRNDIQFHWQNQNYQSFDDYLAQLSSRKRKQVKKERRLAQAHGLDIRIESGDQLSRGDWVSIYQLHVDIFKRKYGTPTLNADFFEYLGKNMPEQVLVAASREDGQIRAYSLFFRSNSHLYGRLWGCEDYYDNLHFESCYYQGIDYCIEHGLQTFDPGAQGEHKLSRGFLPTKTWSGHWFVIPEFSEAVESFLQQEHRHIQRYQDELMEHSPYRKSDQ